MSKPKILIVDIETAPILGYTWGLFEQNIGLNQIHKDWHMLSYAAKWLDQKEIFYKDQRGKKDIENDFELLKEVWKLLDDADIVVGQNSKAFDIKKLNTRFVMNGMQPPSSFKQIDTLTLAKKYFEFTSNKLEYLTDKLCTKYKKLSHSKFSGFELWKECLAGNKEAWDEMAKYNKQDVLATEELYKVLRAWDTSIDLNVYSDSTDVVCVCGNKKFKKRGFHYSGVGKYQRFKCTSCGKETRSKVNLLTKEKKDSLKI